MNQLDDHTRRALCAADQPPPGVEDRILGAILGPAGGGPDGGGLEPSGGASPGMGIGQSGLAHALKIVGATLGLAAGGVALLAVTAAAVRETKSAPPDATVQVEAPAERTPSSPIAAELEPEPPPTPLAEPHPESDSDLGPAPAPSSLAPSKPTPASQPSPTLEAELALMKLARESGDPKRALATLERHRLEFAAGVFAAEREVLRVEQLCALGRDAEAVTLAASFVREHPDNPLRSRVEPACKAQK